MSARKLLLVEDESNLLNSLSFILEQNGFEVLCAKTGEEGVELASRHEPDLVLLDIGLPGMDGFEVASRLAAQRERGLRIVFLTGSNEDDDVVRAFEGCADDYIVKPLRPRVLIARINALFARREPLTNPEAPIVCGPLWLDPASLEVKLEGVPLSLTPTELKVLMLLAQNPGRAFMRSAIIDEVYGEGCHLTEKTIDFQVHGLRQKLGAHSTLLVNVRGFGFKLVAG